jgi:ATP-dependent DNA helicase PIF1
MRKTGVRRIYKTATTGVASLHIGGRTIHSWSGIGLAEGSFKEIIAAVCTDVSTSKRWAEAELLIIDESELVTLNLASSNTYSYKLFSLDDGR